MTCDKLIFPSSITRIIRHFFIPCPVFDHFSFMGAIDATTVRWSEAQLHPRQMETETTTPFASSATSTSTPFSSEGGVTLEVVMAQLQRMDARLDTLSDELCQVNTHVNCIAKRQARLGGFMASPFPSPAAFEDDDDDSDSDDDDDDEDENASSPNDNEMST